MFCYKNLRTPPIYGRSQVPPCQCHSASAEQPVRFPPSKVVLVTMVAFRSRHAQFMRFKGIPWVRSFDRSTLIVAEL